MKWKLNFLTRVWLPFSLISSAHALNYDPLAVNSSAPQIIDLTVHDDARHRDIPVRVYLPTNTAPVPVVLFSHGLGGNRENSPYLGEHWAARGYVAVFLQHPGSDDSVWKNSPAKNRMASMNQAASLENFTLRVKDVPAVLDQLTIWNAQTNSPLNGRMNLQKVGMSGHSFGAVTTEAVSGEYFPLSGKKLTDPRITAAIAFSPSPPKAGSLAKAFGSVKIPWLLMTGTKDTAPIGNTSVADRLAVYPNLKGAPKYEVVLNKAEHSAFTDRALPGEKEARNPNHHRVILALSTAFWDANLKNDAAAKAWLDGAGPRSVLQVEDRWQCAPQ
jgi:predicted dienelactone hydrolase